LARTADSDCTGCACATCSAAPSSPPSAPCGLGQAQLALLDQRFVHHVQGGDDVLVAAPDFDPRTGLKAFRLAHRAIGAQATGS
jgi:hypothetical protein